MDYSARVNAVVDEPAGDLDTEAKVDSVRNNVKNLGRPTTYNHQLVANYHIPTEKSPVLDWINADFRYEATFNWMTGAIGQRDTLGNVIQNTRDRSINGKLDLVQLYNKVNKLNALNSPKRPSIPGQSDNEKEKEEINTDGWSNELLKVAMMVKEISGRYSIVEGTFLPG